MVAFVVAEARQPHPMLPLSIFRSRQFSAANAVTFVVYGAFGGIFFLLVLQLQVVAGYSPARGRRRAAAGHRRDAAAVRTRRPARAADRPAPADDPRPAGLRGRGPADAAHRADAPYVGDVLPGVIVFGLGLSLLVAPLTATVLAAVDARHAGVASGVNNAVARAAGLIAVAALPVARRHLRRRLHEPGHVRRRLPYRAADRAGLLVVGAVLSFATISNGLQPDVDRPMCCPVAARPWPSSATPSRPDADLPRPTGRYGRNSAPSARKSPGCAGYAAAASSTRVGSGSPLGGVRWRAGRNSSAPTAATAVAAAATTEPR